MSNSNSESVIEFLGCVPLLQRLPSSSLRKIAQLVTIKHFDSGEYVIREGEAGEGLYFILEGEAEVFGSVHSDDHNRQEVRLKRHDHFGHGIVAYAQQEYVIALTKLTCLVLPHEHGHLMKLKSIWRADETIDRLSLVEHILDLEPIEVNIFKGITLPEAPKSAIVFGGQFVGQALAAASKTVDFLKTVHSLHAHYILGGDFEIPIIYQVHCVHNESSFATRRVDAIQKEIVVFSLVASFQNNFSNPPTAIRKIPCTGALRELMRMILNVQTTTVCAILKEEAGFDHQEATMPTVADSESLLSMAEVGEGHQTGLRISRNNSSKVSTPDIVPWPFEIKLCEPDKSTNQSKGSPSLRYWFRAKGKLSDDQALHRCVGAYASDLIYLQVTLNPHRGSLKLVSASLDHSMWFHRSFRADDWLLYSIDSPAAYNGRVFLHGQIFNMKGELVATVKQVGLIRKARTRASDVVPKL